MYFLAFEKTGWDDYCYWKTQDKKTIKKVDGLIQEIFKNPFEGTGKPEKLRANLSGYWSRRIDDQNRIVYTVVDNFVLIARCKSHYE